MNTDLIRQSDPEIARVIDDEAQRQQSHLELIASENIASRAVMAAQGSILTNKYAEGYPEKRYYGGCEFVDRAEQLAIDRALALFGADSANVQPHSGSQANMAAYFALLEPGDTILGMDLAHGGHLTHGSKVSFSGRLFNFVHYGVNRETETIDYDQVAEMATKHRPKMIVAGASAIRAFSISKPCRTSPHQSTPDDGRHGSHRRSGGGRCSPLADPVQRYRHLDHPQTLRGPRGGLILAREACGKKSTARSFPEFRGDR